MPDHEKVIRAEQEAFARKQRHDRAIAEIKDIPLSTLTVGELVNYLEAIPFTAGSKMASIRNTHTELVLRRLIRTNDPHIVSKKSRPIRDPKKKQWKY